MVMLIKNVLWKVDVPEVMSLNWPLSHLVPWEAGKRIHASLPWTCGCDHKPTRFLICDYVMSSAETLPN